MWDLDVDTNPQTPLLEGNPFRYGYRAVFFRKSTKGTSSGKKGKKTTSSYHTYPNRYTKGNGRHRRPPFMLPCGSVQRRSVLSLFKTMTNCKSFRSLSPIDFRDKDFSSFWIDPLNGINFEKWDRFEKRKSTARL